MIGCGPSPSRSQAFRDKSNLVAAASRSGGFRHPDLPDTGAIPMDNTLIFHDFALLRCGLTGCARAGRPRAQEKAHLVEFYRSQTR